MPSFDIVSKVQMHEVDNAFSQAQKEIAQRFDFKDTDSAIEKSPDAITIHSASENRATAALAVVQEKLAKRKVSLRFFDVGNPNLRARGARASWQKSKTASRPKRGRRSWPT